MTPIRVLVADDQPILRDAIIDLLSADPAITVLGTASTAQETIAQCTTLTPDVILMDVKMPGGGGPKATEEIRRHHPRTRVVAFSAHQDQSTIQEMRNAGAAAYVTKGSPPAEIIAAIHHAAHRPVHPSWAVSGEVVQEAAARLPAEDEQDSPTPH